MVKTKDGHAKFLVFPQIANPQILGPILQLQIRKSLRCASPQINKFVMVNPQIANLQLPWCPSRQIENLQICKENSKLSQKPTKNNSVRKSRIRKLQHLRKVRNKKIHDLRNLFADRQPLVKLYIVLSTCVCKVYRKRPPTICRGSVVARFAFCV
jgi:hypothetical protein